VNGRYSALRHELLGVKFRRTKSVLIALSLAAVVSPAAGDENVRLERTAEADWLVPTQERNHFRWYYAWVEEKTGAGDVPGSFVSVGSGDCVRKKTKQYTSTTCLGKRFAGERGTSGFTMAPDASSAELSFKHKGITNHVTWSGGKQPGPYGAQEWCSDTQGDEGRGFGAGLWRDARATGTIFGSKLTKKTNTFWSGLSTGAMASQCSWVDRSFTKDGRALLKVRVPR
jgi:hypothetical protein